MAVQDYEFDQFRLTPELYRVDARRQAGPAGEDPVRPARSAGGTPPRAACHGEVITAALWGNGGFQDLDQSLNTAIRKVRLALRDSADEPRFIQTVVGRGYRFLPDVSVKNAAVSPEAPSQPVLPAARPGISRLYRLGPDRRFSGTADCRAGSPCARRATRRSSPFCRSTT